MRALGMIESVGMATAIAAADAAVKSANVTLLGYELTNGGGMITIKFEGDVGAVKAALEAGAMTADSIGKVVSKHMIPRPHEEVEKVIFTEETITAAQTKNEPIPNTQRQTTEVAPDSDQVESDREEAESDSDSGSEEEEEEEDSDPNGICNVCHDPECPRRKGDLKTNCIHYQTKWRNAQ